MSKRPNAELAKTALSHTILRLQPATEKLMFHSAQGVQYSAKLVITYLNVLKITQSLRRRENCWDNSHNGSFFQKFKIRAIE